MCSSDLQKKHYCMAQSSFLWMTQVEMAKPIMEWDYFLQKLWLKNMASVQVKQQIFYHFLFSLPTPAEQLLLSEASLRIQTLSPIRR